MEFKVFQKEVELQSRGWIPTFHDISKEVLEITAESGVKNGTCSIVSHHTTCSVMVQESSHDLNSFDIEFMQQDLLDIMRDLIPDYTDIGQYNHPGPIHERFAASYGEKGLFVNFNTDAHLRSAFFSRSEVITIKDGKLDAGEFAHIYFIDWDHVRARRRQANITIMGTTEDVNDRKYKGGEVIDTYRKFTELETTPMEEFDLQQKR